MNCFSVATTTGNKKSRILQHYNSGDITPAWRPRVWVGVCNKSEFSIIFEQRIQHWENESEKSNVVVVVLVVRGWCEGDCIGVEQMGATLYRLCTYMYRIVGVLYASKREIVYRRKDK